jgi:hypothetical protein
MYPKVGPVEETKGGRKEERTSSGYNTYIHGNAIMKLSV